jgi:hypothetical protein
MSISLFESFDLPEWLGTEAVTWRATESLTSGAHVEGALTASAQRHLSFDLLAVDAAYPLPVCPETERRAAHLAWEFGEVVLLDIGGRVAAGVPGSRFDANLACEALRRVAKSVGAPSSNFAVTITL